MQQKKEKDFIPKLNFQKENNLKKVLEVFGEPISRGGQESYVMSILQNMDLSELSIDLFTPYYCNNQECVDYISQIGGKVIHEDMPFIVGGSRREIIPCFDSYLKKNKYDIVHIHSGSVSVLAYYTRIAAKYGIQKIIVHSHSSGAKENIKHFLVKLYASGIFKKFVTDFCACSIEAARWKFPKNVLKNVKILNNGIDLSKYRYNFTARKKMRELYGIDENELILGHVGRFTYEKNQSFLLDILKKYIDTVGSAKLILVGDGDQLKNVELKAERLGLKDKVIFTGSKGNVNEYMNMFDIFLFPSIYEGLGIVGIEAQASGLPVIASDRIPKSICVTNNVSFLSLDKELMWCKEIEKKKNVERISCIEEIKKKGFDILDTSNEVRLMYLSGKKLLKNNYLKYEDE